MVNIQVGDWIRFQRDGRLVLGTVAYTRRSLGGYQLCDTVEYGEVFVDHVLEIRRDAVPLKLKW